MFQVANVSEKDNICDGEAIIVVSACEGVLGFKGEVHWWIRGSNKVKGSDGFSESFPPNRHVGEGQFDLAREGTLGEYCKIREKFSYMVEFETDKLFISNQLLYLVDITIPNSILLMFNY